jgi:hypothetical protein
VVIILEKVEHQTILEALEDSCEIKEKPFRHSNYLVRTLRKSLNINISPKFKQILIYSKIGLNFSHFYTDFDECHNIKKLLGDLHTVKFSHNNIISRENLRKLSSIKKIIICPCKKDLVDCYMEKIENITIEICDKCVSFNTHFSLTFCGNGWYDDSPFIFRLVTPPPINVIVNDNFYTLNYVSENHATENGIKNGIKNGIEKSRNIREKFDKKKANNTGKYNYNKKRGNFRAKTYKRQNYNFR